jgi:hypothetical protein
LILGILLLTFGLAYGVTNWVASNRTGVPATPGTVILSALPVLAGIQLLIAFVSFDMASIPKRAIHAAFFDRTLRG